MADPAPGRDLRVERVLETALYVDDLDRATRFYRDVMGLRPLTANDRIVALDAGKGTVLLLFRRGASAGGVETPNGPIPPHDGHGPGHFAFAIERDSLDGWRRRLRSGGIDIESEMTWARGGVSLYFRDPDGHSVELATPGVWAVY
ncbi:MAG: VOC family protein [Gemmatimonadota bacterium]